MLKTIFILVLQLLCGAAGSQDLSIVPLPVSSKRGGGEFKLTRKTVIVAPDRNDKSTTAFLIQYIENVYGLRLNVVAKASTDFILIKTTTAKVPKDGYALLVKRESISIIGDSYAGTFWGMQTLIQLLEPYDFGSLFGKGNGISVSTLMVPAVLINDFPRFAYRGMHLDVSRHFFPVSFIKKYIDYIALHKMNFFHWHLTDDQGWRVKIKSFPLLTSVGGFRNGTIIGRYPGTSNDNQRYGGFYSQDEIREVVRYATARHITVVPEISMPGHSSAAIAAYPQLSCFPEEPTAKTRLTSKRSDSLRAKGKIKVVPETWGVFEDVLCAGKDSTFIFLEGVLDEVLTLFPSKYIHIGGDEAPKGHWERCSKCKARMKNEGLKNEAQLHTWFLKRIERYLAMRGRVSIRWDQKLEEDLGLESVVMSRSEAPIIMVAGKAPLLIMSPRQPLSFDHAQFKEKDSLADNGFTPIEKVYAYEPAVGALNAGIALPVIGAQANVWTEYLKTPGKVEYMILPRMSALSEVLWSPKASRSWKDFDRRLTSQARRIILWKGSLNN
ncbi:MAG TPA: beta-N-acetylhexosaminidase [Flavisolibacter sp.]|nr:beta-N-acetylhexosaminidase [Flavisolibacter sp.]